MNYPQPNTLTSQYFDELYSQNRDPWGFETSEYEAKKYAATIAALPRNNYLKALEIGGSIGVLTAKLAERCDDLLSVEIAAAPQKIAIERCNLLPQVRFQLLDIVTHYPDEQFDLIVVSEVGYYWCMADLHKVQQNILTSLKPAGQLLLVHWVKDAPDYPLRGDDVHEAFLELSDKSLRHLLSNRNEQYRLDLFEKPEKPDETKDS
jgi:SAM-dependent methyltransferase